MQRNQSCTAQLSLRIADVCIIVCVCVDGTTIDWIEGIPIGVPDNFVQPGENIYFSWIGTHEVGQFSAQARFALCNTGNGYTTLVTCLCV